jgi:hypothetical protein
MQSRRGRAPLAPDDLRRSRSDRDRGRSTASPTPASRDAPSHRGGASPLPPSRAAAGVSSARSHYLLLAFASRRNIVYSVQTGLWCPDRKMEARLEEFFLDGGRTWLIFGEKRSDFVMVRATLSAM